MNNRILAKRYINAFIGQNNQSDVIENLQSLKFILENISDNSVLLSFLLSPLPQKNQKEEVLHSLIQKTTHTTRITSFFNLLISKNRLPLIPDLSEELGIALSKLQKKFSVTVEVAETPSADSQSKISAFLSAQCTQKLDIQYQINPDVIGGFRATIGNRVYDGSLQNTLANLKQNMLTLN